MLFLELHGVKCTVWTILTQQLFVLTGLNDFPVFQNDNQIRIAHRGKTMRNDDRGAFRHQFVERMLHDGFGNGVQRTGGFVKDQNGRIVQNGPCDRNALFLSAGQRNAVFADLGFEPVGQVADKLVSVRHLRRPTISSKLVSSFP